MHGTPAHLSTGAEPTLDITLVTMHPQKRAVIVSPRIGRPSTGPKVLLPVKVSPALRTRVKVAAAQEDMTYAQLIEHLLDMRDDRLRRQQAQQAHPFHRPGRDAAS
jgi:hypothetical protein